MIRGYFENCYGLKEFTLPNIDFTNSNRAIIYAPNGVMKSSLSKVFDDISKGNRTTDRIFTGVISSYLNFPTCKIRESLEKERENNKKIQTT